MSSKLQCKYPKSFVFLSNENFLKSQTHSIPEIQPLETKRNHMKNQKKKIISFRITK